MVVLRSRRAGTDTELLCCAGQATALDDRDEHPVACQSVHAKNLNRGVSAFTREFYGRTAEPTLAEDQCDPMFTAWGHFTGGLCSIF